MVRCRCDYVWVWLGVGVVRCRCGYVCVWLGVGVG